MLFLHQHLGMTTYWLTGRAGRSLSSPEDERGESSNGCDVMNLDDIDLEYMDQEETRVQRDNRNRLCLKGGNPIQQRLYVTC
jgi:hypothetical protein